MSTVRPFQVSAWPQLGHWQTRAARLGRLGLAMLMLASMIWAVQGGTKDPKLDTTDTQLVLKGQYLFQFAKGNDWPSQSKSGPFVVAIHNKPALATELANKYGTNPIGAQPLTVQSIEDPSELEAPHVLYTEAEGEALKDLLAAVKGKPTLVVTALQPELLSGVSFNLIKKGDNLRYEINFQDAEKRGILVGNRLASWAIQR